MWFRWVVFGWFLLFCGVVASHAQAIRPKGGIAPPIKTEEQIQRERVFASLPLDAAKRLFGGVSTPAVLPPQAIGGYARGCLAGAQALPLDGDTWQVMRPSRNRFWGHPDLVAIIKKLSHAAVNLGWQGFLVGDLSQPRGGPMLTGHDSHQIGLDADLWLTPLPPARFTQEERETKSAVNLVRGDWMDVDPHVYRAEHLKLLRLVASEGRVARIFINPAIKRALCRDAGEDRVFLRKIRPTLGHNYHFHIRLSCPMGSEGCRDQPDPPLGDGCGAELEAALQHQQDLFLHPPPPKPPAPPLTLADLPKQCRAISLAP